MPLIPIDASRLDNLSIGLFFAAVACLLVALIWLGVLTIIAVVRGWKKVRWPIGLLLVGLILGALPLLWTTFGGEVIDLGPRTRMVDGELHMTLTGWDRPPDDYRGLVQYPNIVVLQMANADVNDDVVEFLNGQQKLRELDLNDSQITDAALPTLAALPALERLRIRNTKVTDAGFQEFLAEKESLEQLDVRGTAIEKPTIDAWREAGEGRRAMGP